MGRWYQSKPTVLYVGRREALLAEIGDHLAIYQGKYLVYPYDGEGNGNFDAEGATSKKQVNDLIRSYREFYPNIQIAWL